MQLVICEEDSKVKLLLQKPSRYLRKIVCVKEVYPETYKIAAGVNVEIYRFEQVEKLGAEKMNKEVVSLFSYFLYIFLCFSIIFYIILFMYYYII